MTHNIGSLPHTRGRLSRRLVRKLLASAPWFAYLPHALTLGENLAIVRHARKHGGTINALVSNETEADRLASSGLLVVLLQQPGDSRTHWQTPAGLPVIACPGTDCASCRLCWDRPAGLIVAIRET